MQNNASTHVSMNIANNVLIVSVQVELYDEMMTLLQGDIMNMVYSEKEIKGVLIDVSGVEIIDSFILRMLMDTAKMVKLLGAPTLFTGIKPEIVASLVDFGSIAKDIRVVLNADEGIKALNTI